MGVVCLLPELYDYVWFWSVENAVSFPACELTGAVVVVERVGVANVILQRLIVCMESLTET